MVAAPWLEEAVLPILREGGQGGTHVQHNSPPDDSSVSSTDSSESSVLEHSMDNETDLADYGPSMTALKKLVQDQHDLTGGQNTRQQYTPLYNEYKEFSLAIYKDEKIVVERLFKFLQFQAHREQRTGPALIEPDADDDLASQDKDIIHDPLHKIIMLELKKRSRKRKRNKSGKTRAKTKYHFQVDDYKKVMDHIQNDIIGKEVHQWVFHNRLKNVGKYRNAVKHFADDATKKAIADCHAISLLVSNVELRKKMADVEENNPHLCRVTEKFQYPKLYKLTEQFLWDEYQKGINWKYLTRAFRDRYTFLMSVQTCTRHEATVSSMLSSFDVADIELPGELENYSLLMRNIYKGKTNQEDSKTILTAKSIRHKNVFLCEQGALAIYLFTRFRIHDEDFNLLSNESYGKVRATVAVNHNTQKQFYKARVKCMGAGTYYAKLCDAFAYFGFNVSHVIHFGRACTPVLLEFASVLIEQIEMLGDWNQDKYRKSYSLNLPWEALRAAAGFPKEIGHYRLPRNKLPVPDSLKKKVFPNITRAQAIIESLPKERQFRLPRAHMFLRVMKYLSGVFVQDVCALRLEGRDMHYLFSDPFFQDTEFLDYERRFLDVYKHHTDPANDPTLDPIRVAAPHMANHLGSIKSFTYHGFGAVNRQLDVVQLQNQEMLKLLKQNKAASDHVVHVIGSAFQAGYEAHLGSPSRPSHQNLNEDSSPSANHISPSPRNGTPPTSPTTGTSPGQNTTTTNVEGQPLAFPTFDRLCYDSIDQIHSDWFGMPDSAYTHLSGLKSLYSCRKWRKSLGNCPHKRENDKKMLQKLKRIGDFMEHHQQRGLSPDQVKDIIRDFLEKSPKSKETLTGIDKLIKKNKGTPLVGNELPANETDNVERDEVEGNASV